MDPNTTFTAFAGNKCLVSGPLETMLRAVREHANTAGLLIFDDQTGRQTDFDFRGSIEDIMERALPRVTRPGPGRPKLGVVSREVSLLPRHWDWLEAQPNGASAALRRLVDEARKNDGGETETRQRIDAAGRVMTALAGNLPGFEEAYRALYARDLNRLQQHTSGWPPDIRAYLLEQSIPAVD